MKLKILTFMFSASNMNLPSLSFQRPKIKITLSSSQEVSVFDNRSGLQLLAEYPTLPPSYSSISVLKFVGAIHGHWGRGLVPIISFSTPAWCKVRVRPLVTVE